VPRDGSEVIWCSETNYLFRLSTIQHQLLDWLDADPDVITPTSGMRSRPVCATSPSRGSRSRGAFQCPATPSRRCTCGSMRCRAT
jgi:hypothetical protein